MVLDYPLEFTQTEVSGALIPRLWAYQKVQALEAQIARFGAQRELLDDILALGLDYRLVTRRTSLFAPDEGVEINPEPREGSVTAVHDEHQTARWLDRDFILHDDVWIDLAYQPGMLKESYVCWSEFSYQAGSWDRPRRVVAKVEWHQGELFPRVGFIVTNMSAKPEGVVHFYHGRGTAEQC